VSFDGFGGADCAIGCDGGIREAAPDAAPPDTATMGQGPDVAAADGESSDAATTHDAVSAQDATSAADAPDAADAAATTNDAGDAANAADATEAGTASAYAAAVLADTPLAYWRLGEPSGSTTCVDQTGHGHNATVVGTVTLGVPGALAHDPNTAVQFDGTSGSIDAGNILDSPSPAAFSWEVWVKPTTIGAFRDFFSRMTYNAAGNPISGTYMFAWKGTGMNLGFERWVGAGAVLAIDTPGLTVGAWAHLVGTVDASGNGVLWINGAQAGTGGTSSNVPSTAAHIIFGGSLPCVLDEIAIYDHALSAQSVAAHWAAATQ
jgi:hypothetical protein